MGIQKIEGLGTDGHQGQGREQPKVIFRFLPCTAGR